MPWRANSDAAPKRAGRRIRRCADADEQNSSSLALAAVEVKRLISGSAKITALERARQSPADTVIERAKLSGQLGALL
jgi:hypothetical protein